MQDFERFDLKTLFTDPVAFVGFGVGVIAGLSVLLFLMLFGVQT